MDGCPSSTKTPGSWLPRDRLSTGATRTFFFLGRDPDKGRLLGGATDRTRGHREVSRRTRTCEAVGWVRTWPGSAGRG